MKPQSRKDNIVVQTAQDETLVYDLTANRALLLNATSAFVWQMCDGTRDISELSTELAVEFKQKADENLVWLAIEQLKENNLLENPQEISAPFAGNSRREAIKRIGLSTMIALPIISALLAPTSAKAASTCIADFTSGCTINNNTQSNCCSTTQRCLSGNCSACFPTGTSVGPLATSQTDCDNRPLGNACCSGGTTYNGINSCICN